MAKHYDVPVLEPSRGLRWRFWLLSRRMPLEYRPWVVVQVLDPGFAARKIRTLMVLQLALIVVPQGLLALASGNGWRWITPAVVLTLVVVMRLASKPLTRRGQDQLLAYHGVTRQGELREPVSAWVSSPLSKWGVALFAAQVLLVTAGIGVAVDITKERNRCKPVPADEMAALLPLLGKPGVPGFGPVPLAPEGSTLLHARRVNTYISNLHYLAADVRRPDGSVVGPAVWRVITPGDLFHPNGLEIHAQDGLARSLTPSTGYGSGTPADPLLGKARDCVEDAR